MARTVAEYRTINPALSRCVHESSPHKHRIACFCAKDNFFAGAGEEFSLSPVSVAVSGVVLFIEFEAVTIAVLR